MSEPERIGPEETHGKLKTGDCSPGVRLRQR